MKNILLSSVAAIVAFNSEIVEVVTIETENGPVRINKSDYDPDKHTLSGAQPREDGPTIEEFVAAGYDPKNYPPKGYLSRSSDEEIAAAIKAKEAPAEPQQTGENATQPTGEQQPQANTAEPAQQPVQRLVSQFGAKYFIVDGGGNKLTGEGIDNKGYKTEADAWAAVVALPAAAPVA